MSDGELKADDSKRIILKSKDNNIKLWDRTKIQNDATNDVDKKRKNFSPQKRTIEASKILRANVLNPESSLKKSRLFNYSTLLTNNKKKFIDLNSLKNSSKVVVVEQGNVKVEKLTNENASPNLAKEQMIPSDRDKLEKNEPPLFKSPTMFQFGTSRVQKQYPSTSANSTFQQTCPCNGKGAVCLLCLTKDKMDAPRGGTSGFRAPEVLFRYLYQTTAVDIWASGVVMLCILSKCYPFFNSSTDLVSLAEIMTVFGTGRTIEVALKFGNLE